MEVEILVEESGTLAGLQERLMAWKPGHIDVIHLAGHADVLKGRPCFFTEDAIGRKKEATAEDIARDSETASRSCSSSRDVGRGRPPIRVPSPRSARPW